ncbi:MAG: glycoside hydrolase family 57 protein [Candidatus Sericytochromatia bacterium]|nr:glycoside hydrolase family 57 protein [Candidatus Sericytochromatia bacterium]
MLRHLALGALLASGMPGGAAPAPSDEPQAHLALVWHQHQPRYPMRPGTRTFEQPWVRLHAAKDYADMLLLVREFPTLRATFNLTPVLLAQLDDYAQGATDRHAELASQDPASWSEATRREAGDRFFQVSGPMLAQWPQLARLKAKGWQAMSAQDWRDAAVLFHLAWTDRDFLRDEPYRALAAKGQGYTTDDARALLALHRRLMNDVVRLHREAQDAGQVEVTTTPYAHPILPLLVDGRLAAEAQPGDPLPGRPFRFPQDAAHHVDRARLDYVKRFGRQPRGMWPGEGSVAQGVLPLFQAAGVQWIATDEEVLARSLGRDLVGEARGALYHPYREGKGPAVFFRDRRLSDDIGFRYNRMPAEEAAADFLGQVKAIAQAQAGGPPVISVILDGENAWEWYPDDGKGFLRALYRGLTTTPGLQTVTPGAYLATHQPRALPRLWPGSWINASFATWIGEEDENQAWEALREAREAVARFSRRHGETDRRARAALETLYVAEGSDWFWWYGKDQSSGRDHEFDAAYRGLLRTAYRQLGEAPPAALDRPFPHAAGRHPQAGRAFTPVLDGRRAPGEWDGAVQVQATGQTMQADRPLEALWYGHDARHRYVAVQFSGRRTGATLHLAPLAPVDLGGPAGVRTLPSGVRVAAGPRVVEVALPSRLLPASATLEVRCRDQRLPEVPVGLPGGE